MLSIGVYPDVTLADAREKRSEARKILAAGGAMVLSICAWAADAAMTVVLSTLNSHVLSIK